MANAADMLEARCHWAVCSVVGVLLVDHRSHSLQRTQRLCLGYHTVMQPIRELLAQDAERRTILHQADVINIGKPGAPDALVYPPHNITQNALRVIVELALNVFAAPLDARDDRNG